MPPTPTRSLIACPHAHAHASHEAAVRLRLGAVVCSRKPFLKRRGMCLMWRMRPVPFVRLRSAFSDQLNRRILAPG